MKPVKVTSKAITQVQYNNGELHVWFTDKSFRTYYNVPEKQYEYLLRAESIGAYFNFHIREEYKSG